MAATPVLAEWAVPAEFQEKVAALSPRQSEFISSGAILDYIPERQLEHELATRDTTSLQQLLDDLLSLAAQMGYDPARDMGAIPLNLASRRFNLPRPTPAPLRELKRESGPFSVHRYLAPMSGVPTFGGARIAIYPEDLVAGKVDVAIVGVPSNMSSGRRDAINAPGEMRALNTIGNRDAKSLLDPMEVLVVVDYGDFHADRLSVEMTTAHVTGMVAETAATGAVPMLVGGDTSLLFAGVKGVAEHRGQGSFGLLHLSAHADAERHDAHSISDQQALFALLDQGLVKGNEAIPVGLRGPGLDSATLEWLRGQKVRYHTMAEVDERGFEQVLDDVLAEVQRGPDGFYVSIDVSIVDPVEMVAAGRLETSGLRMRQVTRAIREVCATKRIVGFGITDLAPMLDLSRLSVVNANAMLNACLVGMAVRKSGLDPDYIHPLVRGHGQR